MGHVTAWRPARIEDVAALELRLSRRNLARLITQTGSYPSFTLELDARPVAVVTLAAAAGGRLEMALLAHSALRTMPGRIAALRQIVVCAAGMLPSMDAIMRISDSNPAGQKIARSATFVATGELIEGTSVRTWLRAAPLPLKLTPAGAP